MDAITNILVMEPLELFLSFLNRFVPLTRDEFQTLIVPFIEVRMFKKKALITRAGEVENYVNFVSQGLVRKYFTKDDNEIVTRIAHEGELVQALDSFYNRTPSQYYLEAVEPCSLLCISYPNQEIIFSLGAQMERLGRLLVTDALLNNDRWQMNLRKLPPRELFLNFVHNNPELMQRVPQKYLASLLNIQPETFSRFKHLLKAGAGSYGTEDR